MSLIRIWLDFVAQVLNEYPIDLKGTFGSGAKNGRNGSLNEAQVLASSRISNK